MVVGPHKFGPALFVADKSGTISVFSVPSLELASLGLGRVAIRRYQVEKGSVSIWHTPVPSLTPLSMA